MQEAHTFKVSGTAYPTTQCPISEGLKSRDRMLLWRKSQLQTTVMWDMVLHWLVICYHCLRGGCCCFSLQGSPSSMIAWTQCCFESLQSGQSYCAQTVTLLSVCTELSLLCGSRMKKWSAAKYCSPHETLWSSPGGFTWIPVYPLHRHMSLMHPSQEHLEFLEIWTLIPGSSVSQSKWIGMGNQILGLKG